MRIDPGLVAEYQRDGVVILRNLVSAEALQNLADGVDWQRIRQFAEVGTQGPVPEAALQIMDTREARLFHEHVLVKEAETKEITPWHHDDPYYGIDGMDSVSIWIPLDPIPVEVALSFIAGSHRWNRRFIPRRFADQSEYVDAARDFEHLPMELCPDPAGFMVGAKQGVR